MSCAILIVGFHAYDALERCLASLPQYLASGDEVIVVDHESDERALRAALKNCPVATGIPYADNPGFAAGVNRAARRASAPYLMCLNPDAELLGPVPRVLEAWLGAHDGVGVVGPRVLDADGGVQSSARRFPGLSTVFGGRSTWLSRRFPGNWFTERNVLGRGATEPVVVDWVAGSCLMTRRDAFDRLGGFDERFFLYWEDADYCRRAASLGFQTMYVPGVEVRHTAGASSAYAHRRAIREFHESAFLWHQKHTGTIGRLLAPVVHAGLRLRGSLQSRRVGRSGVPPNARR